MFFKNSGWKCAQFPRTVCERSLCASQLNPQLQVKGKEACTNLTAKGNTVSRIFTLNTSTLNRDCTGVFGSWRTVLSNNKMGWHSLGLKRLAKVGLLKERVDKSLLSFKNTGLVIWVGGYSFANNSPSRCDKIL